MRLPLTLVLTATLVLTSCGAIRESRLNPLNWFGRSKEAQTQEFATGVVADKRPLAEQVLAMSIEKTPNGAIVRATGLS